MTRDPFDEFKRIEKLFQKVMGGSDRLSGGAGYSIKVRSSGGNTQIDVRGDVSKEDIENLRRRYPDAEISVNDKRVKGSGPVEVIDEISEEPERESDEDEEKLIEKIEEEELDPEKLALKRFKEKSKS